MAAIEDNDACDNWEELEDSGELDKKLKIMQPRRDQQSNQSNGAVVIIQDESLRSMLGPQEPTVKILKRPTKTSDSQVTPDQPVRRHKTLQEREQEYAEARLRILGSACSPLEANNSNSNNDNVKGIQPQTNGHLNGPKSGDQQCLRQDLDSNVIRVPKGPDGTKGFSRR
ncbi:SUZ domain-containing protein 1-like [Neocloeon triangulifer]|uniref:SUZ domain-containing protein 1-like n=1 Tax=Neocloeon triangulifer TaxID=2078957 RepID=UPI00286F08DA|nr:SUZ domain-containing protein 1-like [Neocloeon triangulifer]